MYQRIQRTLLCLFVTLYVAEVNSFFVNEVNFNHPTNAADYKQYIELKPHTSSDQCTPTTGNMAAVLIIRDSMKNLTVLSSLIWEKSNLGTNVVLLLRYPFDVEDDWVRNHTTNAIAWPRSGVPIDVSDGSSVIFVVVLTGLAAIDLDNVPGYPKNVNKQQHLVNTALLNLVAEKSSAVIAATDWRNPVYDCFSMHLLRYKNATHAPAILRETDKFGSKDVSLSMCPIRSSQRRAEKKWYVTRTTPGSNNDCGQRLPMFQPNELMSILYDRALIKYSTIHSTNSSTACDYRFPLSGAGRTMSMSYFGETSIAKAHAKQSNRLFTSRRRRHSTHRHRRSGKHTKDCSTTKPLVRVKCVLNEINLNNRPKSEREYLEILCLKPKSGPLQRRGQNFLIVALTPSSYDINVIELTLFIRMPLTVFPYVTNTDFLDPQRFLLISNGTQTRFTDGSRITPAVDLSKDHFVLPPDTIRSPSASYFPDNNYGPTLLLFIQSTKPSAFDKIFGKLQFQPKITLSLNELDILHTELHESTSSKVLDAIIYARCGGTAVVPYFLRVVPQLDTVGQYIARDCDIGDEDFSLSLCADGLLAPFQIKLFRATKKSPAEMNMCETTLVASFPADQSTSTCQPGDESMLTPDCTQPKNDASIEQADMRAKRTFGQAFGAMKAHQRQTALHKINVLELRQFVAGEELNVEDIKEHVCFDELFSPEIFTEAFEQKEGFELTSWLAIRWPSAGESCSMTQLADAAILKLGDEINLVGKSPTLAKWQTVRSLSLYNDHDFLHNNGKFKANLLAMLKKHATKSRTRFTALGMLAMKTGKLAQDKLSELQEMIDSLLDGQLGTMCRQMKLIYFMAQNGMAMNKYPRLLQFVNVVFNQQLGTAHRSRNSAKKILQHIADGVHKSLVDLIVSDHVLAVSLIIDDTASITGNRKFMAIKARLLTQFADVEAGDVNSQEVIVSTHFYAMLELEPEKETLRVTAGQHLTALVKQIGIDNTVNDRFAGAIARKLKSVTCDAAQVNLKLVSKEMASFFGKPIPIVLCASHRLQTTIGDAYKNILWHKDIRQQVKRLYSMFRGNTMHLLREKSAQMRRKAIPIRNVFDIRWLAHDQRALSSVMKQWPAIYQSLSDNTRMVPEKRLKAKEYATALCNRTTLLYMSFELDVLSVLAPLSVKMQEVNAMAPDIHLMVEQAVNKLDSLKHADLTAYSGHWLKELVLKSTCDGAMCSSVTQYLSAISLTYGGITLKKNTALPEFTNEERLMLINNMQQQFRDSRFSPSKYLIVNSKILAGSSLKTALLGSITPTVEAYGTQEMKYLAEMTNSDVESVVHQWNALKIKLRHEHQLLSSSTRVILSTLLTSTEFIPAHHRELRTVISSVLAVEPTSAGAESLFSIYNHVHSINRKCMSIEVINNELTIRTHYERPEHWQAFESALYWAGKGNRLTRTTVATRRIDGVQKTTLWAEADDDDSDYAPDDDSECDDEDDSNDDDFDDAGWDDFDDDFVDMILRFSFVFHHIHTAHAKSIKN